MFGTSWAMSTKARNSHTQLNVVDRGLEEQSEFFQSHVCNGCELFIECSSTVAVAGSFDAGNLIYCQKYWDAIGIDLNADGSLIE